MSTLIESPKTAVLQIAADSTAGPKRMLDCEFSGKNGKRLTLNSPERITVLTPVTLEYNDALFLGEVVACRTHGSKSFEVEIKIDQILTGLESLVKLRERLLGEGYAHTPAQVGTPEYVTRRL